MSAHTLFNGFLWAWIGIAVTTFIILRFVTAPYGRHTRGNWGPTISNRWGWIIMESPTLVMMPLLIGLGPVVLDGPALFLASAYLLHYIHRVLIFPFRIRTQGKRMPVVVMGSAVFFNLINAGSLGYWLGWDRAPFAPDFWSQWSTWAGLGLFLGGAILNIHSDYLLIGLRKGSDKGYQIPKGGGFSLISCPNHLGEMIEWCGFALMAGSLAPLAFAVWTIANLLPRALDHHQWYKKQFAQYPTDRRAVIPFIL